MLELCESRLGLRLSEERGFGDFFDGERGELEGEREAVVIVAEGGT